METRTSGITFICVMIYVSCFSTFLKRTTLVTCIWGLFIFSGYAQSSSSFFTPADSLHKNRLYFGIGTSATAYGLTMVGLSQAWYKESLTPRFHFKDDWDGWLQMDKLGHSMTNYFESLWVTDCLMWAGVDRRTASWYGVGAGTLFQSSIEILDGFSDRWGFSWTDVAANTTGAALFIGQEYLWQEQRIQLKWSTQRVNYPDYTLTSVDGSSSMSLRQRAMDVFGSSVAERMLKDYNGQTIWLSFNVTDFVPETSIWPEWLNISVGYGAQQMLGGLGNAWTYQGAAYQLPETAYAPYRQFYIGPDINFRKIRTNSPFINTLLNMLNTLRLPLPALEYNTRGEWIWRWYII